MIAQQSLIAWRTHAPWPDDGQVEQDYLLSQAVAAIFQDNFLQQHVAMRGGTVLHKAHLAPAARYSEDIDLVLVTDRAPGHIARALKRVLKPLLGEPQESAIAFIQLAVRNAFGKSKILRTKYNYETTNSALQARAELKVEVNVSEQKSYYPMVPVQFAYPDGAHLEQVTVQSYDIDEMMGTKMRALLQREHGRDLFDLWWAWTMSKDKSSAYPINPKRVADAFSFYMEQEKSRFTAVDFERELRMRMGKPKFRNDLNTMLRPGLTNYDVDIACDEFCEIFLTPLR